MKSHALTPEANARSGCSVLLIEDEHRLARTINMFLTRLGYKVFEASSGEAGLELFDRVKPQVVLLDYNLPGISGLEVLAGISARNADARVVMMTGEGSETTAVTAILGGVADYLIKPIVLAAMLPLIDRLSGCAVQAEPAAAAPVRDGGAVPPVLQLVRDSGKAGKPTVHIGADKAGAPRTGLLGESAPMHALTRLIGKINEADLQTSGLESPAVLVTGETGTGKELVARALHYDGRRKAGPFIELNCAGIPASLLEAELFGYERGAFTDAKTAKLGLIESATGGTLFLDEIGDLDLGSQAKLLKVLEERRVRRLGSVQERSVDARFLAATSCDLEGMVRDGRFRADLYYRLRMIHVHVPALREHSVDVPRLAAHYLDIYAARYGKPGLRISSEAMAALSRHTWPGNVRELKNTIEQAVVLAAANVINSADLLRLPRPASHHYH
ncbi:MAG: sigma-54 dependent transcriptional regulator [Betaproteobacteria bacterium]